MQFSRGYRSLKELPWGAFPLRKRNLLASGSTKDYLTLSERSLSTITVSDPARAEACCVGACDSRAGGGQNSYRRIRDHTRDRPEHVPVGTPWRSGFCPAVRFFAGCGWRYHSVRAGEPAAHPPCEPPCGSAQPGRQRQFSRRPGGCAGPAGCACFRQGISGPRDAHSSWQTAH
jgi:hypothetical protein